MESTPSLPASPLNAAAAAQSVIEARIQPIPRTSAISIELANDYLIWGFDGAGDQKGLRCGILIDPRMYEPATAEAYLQRLTQLNRDSGCEIRLYLSLSDAILRSFFVPAVPKAELRQVVLWEAGKVFPFQPEEELFEWRVIDTLEWGGVKKHQIQAAAIPPARIQPICDLLTSHFKLKAFTLTSLAWEPQLALLQKKLPTVAEKSVAIIRLFGSRLSVMCFHRMSLEFIRENDLDSAVTGDDFENSLSHLQDGEVHSCDFNTYKGFDCDAMARLVGEELDYYYGRFSQRSVELLLLALPFELENPARTALGAALGIPVESLIAAGVSGGVLSATSAHLLAPAALKGALRTKPLDLLPKKYQSALREQKLFRGSIYFGAVAVLCAVIMVLMQVLEMRDANSGKQKLEQTLLSLQGSDAYLGVVRMQDQSSTWEAQLAQLHGARAAHSDLLRALSQLTPNNIYLSGLQLQMVQNEAGAQTAALSLNGFVTGAEQYPEVTLSEYIKALREQPIITRVHLQNQLLEFINSERRLRFTLVMEVLP